MDSRRAQSCRAYVPALRREHHLREVDRAFSIVGVRTQRAPRNGESLSSEPKNASDDQHGMPNAAGSTIDHDFRKLPYEFAATVVDPIRDQARDSDQARIACWMSARRTPLEVLHTGQFGLHGGLLGVHCQR